MHHRIKKKLPIQSGLPLGKYPYASRLSLLHGRHCDIIHGVVTFVYDITMMAVRNDSVMASSMSSSTAILIEGIEIEANELNSQYILEQGTTR